MMRRLILAAGLAIAAAGCGDESPLPVPTSGVATSTLRISGPVSITPGETGQYIATLQQADGTSRDVTELATWNSLRPGVLAFGAGGLATAVARGETEVRATYQALSAPIVVGVREPGTHKLTGSVIDADTRRGLAGTSVDVSAGTGTGLVALTDAGGRYELHGVAGAVQLRVSNVGYATRVLNVEVPFSIASPALELSPLAPTALMSGDWRLTLANPPPCLDVADELLRPAFDVTVNHSGSTIDARAIGPGVVSDTMTGRVLGSRVTLLLRYFEDPLDGNSYAIVRLVGDRQYIALGGSIEVVLAEGGRRADGVFEGLLAHYPNARFEFGVLLGQERTCTGRWAAALERLN